ncbi:MAG: peptidylprolyl isomerase [Acidimicrobiales bacterium]
MGTEKRERQKANRAARLEAERAAEARARRNRTIRNVVIVGVILVVLMVLAGVLSGCGSSASNVQLSPQGPADRNGTQPSTSGGKAGYGTAACPPEGGTPKPKIDFAAAPKRCIDPAKTYTAKVETTEGTVTLKLDTKRTPITTNNFVVLARYGYFDGTDLFRTEAQTGIIQGGSPHTQGNTDEGPGYTIPDEGVPFAAADYGPGTLAMANSGQPDSASAQFFFLATDGATYLADPAQPGGGSYAVFGTATSGVDVLAKIANLDDGSGQGTPSKQVTINKVTISAS